VTRCSTRGHVSTLPLRLPRRAQAGFGLVELMVSLALGLLVVGGAIVLFSATRQASNSSENLSRIQESVRTSYDIMVREVREAGATPCDSQLLMANVLANAQGGTPTWWATWGEPLRGYDGATAVPGLTTGTAVGERVAGTQALLVRYVTTLDGLAISSHDTTAASMTLNRTNHGVVSGDVIMVCNYGQGAIFEVSNANQATATIVHNTGAGSPGNCSKGLGLPTVCTATGTAYEFRANAMLGRPGASVWFIGNNGRAATGGRSLYRMTRAGVEEVADGVRDLQLTYLVRDAAAYVGPGAVADWTSVIAVRFTITYEGPDTGVSTAGAGQRLVRTAGFTVNLRNLQP
jgi:type IV pilus assembly protein PilW